MHLIKSFQDLQNETCEIWLDDLGNYWIGRSGTKIMNLSVSMLNGIINLLKNDENIK